MDKTRHGVPPTKRLFKVSMLDPSPNLLVHGELLEIRDYQFRSSKRLKSDEAKDVESTKKAGKRRKQIARKGLHSDKTDEDESEASKDDDPISGTDIPIHHVPVAIKPPSIATYKIIKQGEKAMLKDITRDDLTELYRIVMNRYGMNGPEDELEKTFWKYLKNMFEPPLSTDPIWSLLGQQRIISWRYYDTCRVHCLNLESMDIYMLIERKYPLSAEVCKAMLDKKLQGGKPDEDCYKMLKMMEKQAGIRNHMSNRHKDWLVQEQTALGKDFSNPLMVDNLSRIVWLSTHHIWIQNLGPTDEVCEEYALELLGFSNNESSGGNPTPTSEPFTSEFILEEIEAYLKDDLISLEIDHANCDPEGDICLIEKLLNNNLFQLPLMDLKQSKVTEAKSSIEEPPELELKDLPSHLEYVYLEENNKLPVIIAKGLKDDEKKCSFKSAQIS
ncbi:hypothetical protein Tco_1015411 [Tanacetum coccineum]|uniref:Uncharacterized protein n=1 Tax=Tanacetum coccineum TaxID=301880 RepID=A0ABQ5FKV7_9ASTR